MDTEMLAVGFSNGVYYLHKMPEFIMLQSLEALPGAILAIQISPDSSLITISGKSIDQDSREILIWNWESETAILNQKNQISNSLVSDFSPDGHIIASGGEDNLIHLWNTRDGFCFKSFNEHKAAVTGLCFSKSGKYLASCSLDGTVRAFDIQRYRNFRTFTTTESTRLSGVCIDPISEIVCAYSQDTFEIFIWSIKTGHMLERFTGHDAPISSIVFDSSGENLISSSWDSTIKYWCIESSTKKLQDEHIFDNELEITAMALSQDDLLLYIALSNGNMYILQTKDFSHVYSFNIVAIIKQKSFDIGLNIPKDNEVVINHLNLSPDGSLLVICTNSPIILLFCTKTHMVVNKLTVSDTVGSLDLQSDFYKSNISTLKADILAQYSSERSEIPLPGITKKNEDPSLRQLDIHSTSIAFCSKFSITGRSFCVATSIGVLVFCLDTQAQFTNFTPLKLSLNLDPVIVEKYIVEASENSSNELFFKALIGSVLLNRSDLALKVMLQVPIDTVPHIVKDLNDEILLQLIKYLTDFLEQKVCHIQLILLWTNHLLISNYQSLLSLTSKASTSSSTTVFNLVRALQSIKSSLLPQSEYVVGALDLFEEKFEKIKSQKLQNI